MNGGALIDNFLKSRRIELELTLEDVGTYCNVGKSTVRKWENGMINDIGRSKIQKLSEILKVSPLDILRIGESGSPSSSTDFLLSPLEKELIIEFRKTDEIGRSAVLRMLGIEQKGDCEKMA